MHTSYTIWNIIWMNINDWLSSWMPNENAKIATVWGALNVIRVRGKNNSPFAWGGMRKIKQNKYFIPLFFGHNIFILVHDFEVYLKRTQLLPHRVEFWCLLIMWEGMSDRLSVSFRTIRNGNAPFTHWYWFFLLLYILHRYTHTCTKLSPRFGCNTLTENVFNCWK